MKKISKSSKIDKNLPPPQALSKEEARRLLKEGQKAVKSFDKPKLPGDYDIDSGFSKLRGQRLERKCVVCSESLEHVFHKVNSRPDFIGSGYTSWQLKCTRCSSCGLKYDLVGIE